MQQLPTATTFKAPSPRTPEIYTKEELVNYGK